MKYQLAVFDLDGTILNTLDDLADSVNQVCKKYNFPVHSNEEIRMMVGNGVPKLIKRAVPQNTTEELYKKVLSDFIEYYQAHAAIKTKPYDGILQVMETLKQKGIKIGVNSNKVHNACVILCNKYFPGLIDIVCGNKPGNSTKPSPDGLNEIISATAAAASSCVYIGDSDVDYATSLNGGTDFIGAAWGFRGQEFLRRQGVTKIAKSCLELLDFFE